MNERQSPGRLLAQSLLIGKSRSRMCLLFGFDLCSRVSFSAHLHCQVSVSSHVVCTVQVDDNGKAGAIPIFGIYLQHNGMGWLCEYVSEIRSR